MLRMCSPYFDRALSGEWVEAAERRVELEVPSEQELKDLKLLIKLSYSDCYTHDGGRLLPLATRLRLAVRADTLEFVDALDEIVASLLEGLGFEKVSTCMFQEEPAFLVEGTMPLREEVKQLPLCVFKGLLASDALQLQVENEAYALLIAWMHQSIRPIYFDMGYDEREPAEYEDDERAAPFMEMAPLVRFIT